MFLFKNSTIAFDLLYGHHPWKRKSGLRPHPWKYLRVTAAWIANYRSRREIGSQNFGRVMDIRAGARIFSAPLLLPETNPRYWTLFTVPRLEGF